MEALKIQPSGLQQAVRLARYRRQGFVPHGIVWWGNLLSDRVDQEIAGELELPFETREIPLADEAQAKLWILERVLENPHLNAFQRIRVRLQHKALLLKEGRQHMAAKTQGLTEMSNLAPHNSRAQIAKSSGSSEGQVHKVETLLEHASPSILQQLEAGTLKIGAAFEALRSKPAPEDDVMKYGMIYLDTSPNLDAKRLSALPVRRLAAGDAALFCRVHPCDLAKILSCLGGWGFVYQTHFVQPLSRPLICDFSQDHHALLILATRGQVPTPAVEDCPPSLLPASSADERSPEVVFEVMERLFPQAAKVQIGPRSSRPNWAEWDTATARPHRLD